FFLTALFWRQRFAVVGDDQTGSSLLGFDIESGGGSLRRSLGAAKQEVDAVVIGRINFVLHCFAYQFRRIPIRGNCRWLLGKTGDGEQESPSAGIGDGGSERVAQLGVDDRHDRTEHV